MLEGLIERSEHEDTLKHDHGPNPVNLYAFDPGTADLVCPPELFASETVLEPTDWAFGQICQRLGATAFPSSNKSLPADYLKVCPSSMRAEQLNYWTKNTSNRFQWYARGYQDRCRAVLSDRYAVVAITDVLRWAQSALDSHAGSEPVEIYNPVVTADVLHIRILFKNVHTQGGDYAVGGYITTGEIGNRRNGVYPLIQRISCTNSIAIPGDAWSWESRHIGDPLVIQHMMVPAIFNALKGAAEGLEKLLRANEKSLPNFADYVDTLVKGKGWTSETRDGILIGSEGYESLFGVIQGVSWAAKSIEDPDSRADMELAAGALLANV